MATSMTNETLDKRLRKAARDLYGVDARVARAQEYVDGHDARAEALADKADEAQAIVDKADDLRAEQAEAFEYLAKIATRRGLDPTAVQAEVVEEEKAKAQAAADARAAKAAEKAAAADTAA